MACSSSSSNPGCSTSSSRHGPQNRRRSTSVDSLSQVGRLSIGLESSFPQTNYVNRIFGNDLIFACIGGHLGISDLKILRQTCKLLLVKVNNYGRFVNNLQLTICGETMQELCLAESTIPWKAAKIIPGELGFRCFPIIKNALKELTDLHLDHPNAFRPTNLKSSFELIADFIHLKSLALDVEYFYDQPMPILVMCPDLLKSLERLTIVGCLTRKLDMYRKFECNFEKMGTLGLKLKVFEVGEGYKPLFGYGGYSQGSHVITKILQLSTASLTTLNTSCSSEHLQIYYQLNFPMLRVLKLSFKCDVNAAMKFTEFMARHRDLESIHLTIENGNIPSAFLETIQENCFQLRSLILDGGAWLESFPNPQCWDFLDNLVHLKELKVTGSSDVRNRNNFNCENLIYPCLHSLQNLNPAEIGTNYGNFKKIHVENLKSSRAVGWETLTINTLLGFPNLTEVKFTECKDILNDNIIQMICRNLTKLRVFHFGGSEDITDFGLTGETNEGASSGTSLKNLKGLQDIRIYCCAKVTLSGILDSIQFQELKVADLRCGSQVCISDSTLLKIAEKNPSLEYVERYLNDFPSCSFDNIIALNPRLTRVHSSFPPDYTCRSQPENPISWRPSYGVMSCAYSGKQVKLRNFRSPKLNLANGYHLILPSQSNSADGPPSDLDSD